MKYRRPGSSDPEVPKISLRSPAPASPTAERPWSGPWRARGPDRRVRSRRPGNVTARRGEGGVHAAFLVPHPLVEMRDNVVKARDGGVTFRGQVPPYQMVIGEKHFAVGWVVGFEHAPDKG